MKKHYAYMLRCKDNSIYSGYNAHCFDYLEFVPLHIISDPIKPEDRH